jgi:predicted amidophosphoribosyltransferase
LASPLLGVIFLFAMEDLSGSSPATHVKCPACAEPVLREATKCKHCGSALTPQPVDSGATRKAAAKKEIALAFWIVIILCAIYFVLR